jgi:hypothetical protein
MHSPLGIYWNPDYMDRFLGRIIDVKTEYRSNGTGYIQLRDGWHYDPAWLMSVCPYTNEEVVDEGI